MIKGIEHFSADRIPSEMRMAQKFMDLLERNFTEQRQSDFYAQQMGMTLKRLNAMLRMYCGKTAYEMVQARIHEEAERLLGYTNMTVQEIAYELNICNASFFCKCFKDITGKSPQEYRRGLKGL